MDGEIFPNIEFNPQQMAYVPDVRTPKRQNTLRSLRNVPPGLLIFRKLPTQDILILQPPFIKSWKMFQPGYL